METKGKGSQIPLSTPQSIRTQASQNMHSNMEIEEVITSLNLPTLRFYDDPYDTSYTRNPLEAVVKIDLIIRLKGYNETEIARILKNHDEFANRLGCKAIDQSTINRSRRERITDEVEEFVEECATTIGELAVEKGIDVPGYTTDDNEEARKEMARKHAKQITQELRNTVYPHLNLKRANNFSVPESSFYDLQAKMGLNGGHKSEVTANQAAENYVKYNSINAGDNHREQLSKILVTESQGMFQDANQELFDQIQSLIDENEEVWAAIDITPIYFLGDRIGRKKEIPGYKDGSAYQYATIHIIGKDLPSFVLGIEPVKKGYSRRMIVEKLLAKAEYYVDIDLLMMDREFGGQKVVEAVDERDIDFLVQRRITGPTMEADIEHMKEEGKDVWIVERSLSVDVEGEEDRSYDATLLYVPSTQSDDPLAKTAFITNIDKVNEHNVMTITNRYSERWNIENDFKKLKKFMADTRSKSFTLRFFYFMYACLVHNTWRVVDVHVKIRLAPEGEDVLGEIGEPLLTARDFLDIFYKEFVLLEVFDPPDKEVIV